MPSRLEGHTFHRFDGELHHLHIEILQMAGLVLNQTQMALESFQQQNMDIVRIVKKREHKVDTLEKRIDNAITEVLAKRVPFACDLRAIITFSKVVADLERIGDEAVRIAHIATIIYDNGHNKPSVYMLHDVGVMGKIACVSLKEAIQALDTLDRNKANKLLNSHDDLDEEFRASLRRLTTYALEDARNVGHTINIVLALKSLERIGGYARNLAEYAIYLISGEDIRHTENTDQA